jgi:ELWxxDGT repeat protein
MKKILLIALCVFSFCGANAQQLLKDIHVGQDGSDPDFKDAILKDGVLYFTAGETGANKALFKTNGTANGTVKLIGDNSFNVYNTLGFIGDELLFWGGNFTDGVTLYKTNAALNAYSLVKQINAQSFFTYLNLKIKVGNTIYFVAEDGTHGYELWKTDGTGNGTMMVKDINPGSGNSFVVTSTEGYFAALGNTIYFAAGDETNGAELWKSDGTEAGTVLVKDIEPDNTLGAQFGSNPGYLYAFNGKVYFSAYRALDGREPWVTDGTANGTQLIKDLAPGASSPSDFIAYNNAIYFVAYANNEGYTLFKTNGTTAGTSAVRLPSAGGPESIENIVLFKGKLAFASNDQNGNKNIWLSDGTSAGTVKLTNGTTTFDATGEFLLSTSNYLYFTASNNGSKNNLYRSEGTNNSVQKIGTDVNFEADYYDPLFLLNNCVLLLGDNGSTGKEIYTVCNQQTVGIDKIESSAKVRFDLMPNPAKDIVTITTELDGRYAATLFSLQGALISTVEFENSHTLSIGNLSSGVYLLQLRDNNGNVTSKRIIKE